MRRPNRAPRPPRLPGPTPGRASTTAAITRRPDDRRRGACRDRCRRRSPRAWQAIDRRRPIRPREQPGDDGGDDRDVPARDRHDVADAGRRERRREVPIDPIAQPDQDAGGQPSLGLGQRPGQRLSRRASQALDRAGRGAVGPEPLERARSDGCCHADPPEVRAVPAVISRERLEPAAHRHPVAGGDVGVAWECRADAQAGRIRESVAVCCPSRGEPTPSTVAGHGPLPAGIGRSSVAGPPAAIRTVIASTPAEKGTSNFR